MHDLSILSGYGPHGFDGSFDSHLVRLAFTLYEDPRVSRYLTFVDDADNIIGDQVGGVFLRLVKADLSSHRSPPLGKGLTHVPLSEYKITYARALETYKKLALTALCGPLLKGVHEPDLSLKKARERLQVISEVFTRQLKELAATLVRASLLASKTRKPTWLLTRRVNFRATCIVAAETTFDPQTLPGAVSFITTGLEAMEAMEEGNAGFDLA